MKDQLGIGLENGIHTPGVAQGTGVSQVGNCQMSELELMVYNYLKAIDTIEDPLTEYLTQQYSNRIQSLYDEGVLKYLSALFFFDAHSPFAASVNVVNPNMALLAGSMNHKIDKGISFTPGSASAFSSAETYDDINDISNPSFSHGLRITDVKIPPAKDVHICRYNDKEYGTVGLELLFDPVTGLTFNVGDATIAISDNTPGFAFLSTVNGGFRAYYNAATQNVSEVMPLPASFSGAGILEIIPLNGNGKFYNGTIKYYFVGRQLTIDQALAIDGIICNNTLFEPI